MSTGDGVEHEKAYAAAARAWIITCMGVGSRHTAALPYLVLLCALRVKWERSRTKYLLLGSNECVDTLLDSMNNA